MAAIANIKSTSIPSQLKRIDEDPFLRKNQVWFQKTLPPTIAPQKNHIKNPRHLDHLAQNLLNPISHMERAKFAPSPYLGQLKRIVGKIRTMDNQIHQARAIANQIQNEITMREEFYTQWQSQKPC